MRALNRQSKLAELVKRKCQYAKHFSRPGGERILHAAASAPCRRAFAAELLRHRRPSTPRCCRRRQSSPAGRGEIKEIENRRALSACYIDIVSWRYRARVPRPAQSEDKMPIASSARRAAQRRAGGVAGIFVAVIARAACLLARGRRTSPSSLTGMHPRAPAPSACRRRRRVPAREAVSFHHGGRRPKAGRARRPIRNREAAALAASAPRRIGLPQAAAVCGELCGCALPWRNAYT